jgi:hypothetical protein
MTMPTHTSTWQRARRPVLSVLLALAWLTLQQSLDLGNVLTACVLGWGLPRLLGGFLGPAAHPRSFARALRLGLTVLWDIIVSNITVARSGAEPSQRAPSCLGQGAPDADAAHRTGLVGLHHHHDARHRVGHRGRRGGLHLGARPRLR